MVKKNEGVEVNISSFSEPYCKESGKRLLFSHISFVFSWFFVAKSLLLHPLSGDGLQGLPRATKEAFFEWIYINR